MKTRLQIFALLSLFSVTVFSCLVERSSLPDMPVAIIRTISLSGNLSERGGFLYINQRKNEFDRIGFGGILIYHGLNDEYYAVDLACPKDLKSNIIIERPDFSGLCKCPFCGEVYDMSSGFGTPTKGIAKESLKHYVINLIGQDEIQVTN